MNPRNSAAAPAAFLSRIAPVILTTIGMLARAALVIGMMAGLIILLTIATAPARDNGQYGDVPDHIRSWFKSVRSPNGVPCCDIADGHRTTWDRHPGSGNYWVPIAGEWREVVWYVQQGANTYHIRCFVPGGGV